MIKSLKSTVAVTLSAALLASLAQFALVTDAQASSRRPHCASVPVAGHPGVFTVVCTTVRL